jgi:hypothetical protein
LAALIVTVPTAEKPPGTLLMVGCGSVVASAPGCGIM